MGPAQRRAGNTFLIFYGIFVITLLSQIQLADASPLPKTDIPALEGEANYKRWASLVRNSLIVLGLWYTIDEPAPTPEFETVIIKPKTETSPGETKLGEQTNSAEILQWERDDMKASAYISLFTGPTTAHHIDEYEGTAHSNWHALKKAFGKRGAMATFHTLRAFQQFRFDSNTSFAKQIEQLQLAQVELADFGHKITDNEVAIALLMGLPDSWSNVVAAFLATQSDLFKISAHDVRKRIIDESDRVSGNTGTPLLSSVQRAGPSNSSPTGYTSRGKLRLNRYSCTKCGPGGHTDEFCWVLHPEMKRNRVTAKSVNAAVPVDPPPVPPDPSAVLNMMGASPSVLFYFDACNEWMLDSGASDHISPHPSDFLPGSVLNAPGSIRLGNNSTMQYLGIGTVEATTTVNGKSQRISLQRVLYAPDAGARFISISQLTAKGLQVLYTKTDCQISTHDNITRATGTPRNGIYWLPLTTISSSALASLSTVKTPYATWHARLAHTPHTVLRKMRETASVTGFSVDAESTAITSPCAGCAFGKLARQPFRPSFKRALHPLDLVHSDLVGPMQTGSMQGSSYFASFIDDFSGHAVAIPLASKNGLSRALTTFISWAETQSNRKLKVLRSDRGGEYVNAEVRAILERNGTSHNLTAPYSPAQNGRAERWNRTIINSTLSMIHGASMSRGFWEHALQSAVHIYNRTPQRARNWITPHQLWTNGHIPDLSYMRTFGCLAYVATPAERRTKLDPRAKEMVFIGYESGSKAWRFWDRATHRVVISRDAVFNELNFLFQPQPSTPVTSPPAPQPLLPATGTPASDPDPDASPCNGTQFNTSDLADANPQPPPTQHTPATAEAIATDTTRVPPIAPEPSSQVQTPQLPITPPSIAPPVPSRTRATRFMDHSPGDYNGDGGRSHARHAALSGEPEPILVQELPRAPPVSSPTPTALGPLAEPTTPTPPPRRSERITRRPTRYVDSTYGSRSHADVLCDSSDDDEFVTPVAGPSLSSLLAAAPTSADPVSLREARASPNAAEWDDACRYELAMLEGMGTWSLVDLPPGRSAIPNKWVFKLKNDGRFRARLVAKGFKQIHGIDYDEVFSPVARFESLRTLFALAASHDWHIHSMDVKSTFLNGDIEEELYMRQPEGFEITDQADKVCRLQQNEMLGHRLPTHVVLYAQFAQCQPILLAQPVEQFAAAGVSEGFEYFVFIDNHADIIGN